MESKLDPNLVKYNKQQWQEIAKRDYNERDNLSSSAVLIDDIIVSIFASEQKGITVLDYGAGTGIQSRRISKYVKEVISYEPIQEMKEIMISRTNNNLYNNINLTDNINYVNNLKNIDYIVCSRVFEHVENIPKMLKEFSSILSSKKGKLILTLSHPIKFSGDWKKDKRGEYICYEIYNYFNEGKIHRSREDSEGQLLIQDVYIYHRTISTYFNWIRENGFSINKMHEPVPNNSIKNTIPKLYNRLSSIPNCLILECSLNLNDS